MTRWFERLPIHRKLVALAVGVSAASLLTAIIGLNVIDLVRFRSTAREDAGALARVLAENIAAAVAFLDEGQMASTLGSVRARNQVSRACVYLPDGTLATGFARPPDGCPRTIPSALPWNRVAGLAPVERDGRQYGQVYVERNLSDLGRRLMVTSLSGFMMLVAAAAIAYALAERVHGAISRPIAELASAARRFGKDADEPALAIRTSPDEVGDLAASFGDMMARVRAANDDLRRANDALTRENEERRRMEREREEALAREREASRLKDEFLAAVSHEIRTPLNAIAGWAQVLAAGPTDQDTLRRAVASISRNADAQTRVIDDLIDVSRIVTGRLRLAMAPVDLCTIATAGVESVQLAADARGITIDVRLPHESCFVRGDRDRLQQVAWNLMSNAVKFTSTGGRIAVEVCRRAGRIELIVADNGIGIVPDFIPYVFDRFRQADGSMTRQHGGLGLGLAIVKELTELHGGSVKAASEGQGRGAVFTVSLPQISTKELA